MTTEDLAHILLRFEGGMRGSLVVSQVSAGRKNSLRFELDGSRTALAWDSERHEELWLGHREKANEVLMRNPGLLSPEAAAGTTLPAGARRGLRGHVPRALPRRLHGRRGRRAAAGAGLSDVRRRALGERARRRDRAFRP